MNKKEWIDEYKKNSNNYIIEEKNLIHSFLNEDFHLNKIYTTLLKDEVEGEKKIVEETIKQMKAYIEDVHMYFNGNICKIRNFDLRQKIYKVEEVIGKNRMEFKNKFEILLNEEDKLEMELKVFENNFERALNKNNYNNDNFDDDESQNENSDFKQQNKKEIIPTGTDQCPNNYKHKNSSPSEKIDEFISYVLNTANIIFDDFSLEDISKIITQQMTFKDLLLIKNKTSSIDQIIEKFLGGQNLSWQARDHQEFLKFRSAHNCKINSFEFLNDLENAIPFIPRSELKNHIKLFNKFYQLNELKKILISHYKDLKLEKEVKDKSEILEKITNDKRPSTALPGYNKKNTNDLIETKQKLEEWKKKKVQEKQEKFEEQLRIEHEIKEKERLKYNQKNSQIKPMIEEYKKNKSIIKKMSLEFESCNQNKISEVDMERIKEKSEKLVQKKMLIVKSKSLNMIKKAENYTKFKLKKMEEMEKLPVKINEQTQGFQMKQRKKFDKQKDAKKDAYTMANNVLGRMNRAVPEWRKVLI